MNRTCRLLLLALSINYTYQLTAGFVAGTLIKLGPTSRRIRYIPIEQLQKRKFICSYNLDKDIVERQVTQATKRHVSKYLRIMVDGQDIDVSFDQLFYMPLLYEWLPAENLEPGMTLLKGTDEFVIIDDILELSEDVTVYDVSVAHYRNFYVSKSDIVVYNCKSKS